MLTAERRSSLLDRTGTDRAAEGQEIVALPLLSIVVFRLASVELEERVEVEQLACLGTPLLRGRLWLSLPWLRRQVVRLLLAVELKWA
jgi:hypothetical protein